MSLRRPVRPGLRVPVLLAAATAVAVLAGCSSGGTNSDSTAGVTLAHVGHLEQSTITVGAVPTTDSTGLYVAEYKGLFAKYGLHVNIVPETSAETAVNAMALNQIQILTGNYVSFIEAQINWDNGVKPKALANPSDAQISADVDLFAEASIEQPGFVGLFTPPGSKITTIQDLKGKSIGINAPNNVAYLLTAAFLEANDIPPSSVHFVSIPFPNMEKAVLTNKVDVAFLAEPFISIAEETGPVTMLTNLDEGATAAMPIQGYAATKSYARSHPNTMAAFENALEQGQQLATSDRHLAEVATAKYAFPPGTPTPALFTAIMQFENYPLGNVDVARLQRVASLMHSFGLIKQFNVEKMLGD
jgi:NitT/TauT family transport system substrate-binding protein